MMSGAVTSALRLGVGSDPSEDVSRLETCCIAALFAKVRQYDSRWTGKLQCRLGGAGLPLPRLTSALPFAMKKPAERWSVLRHVYLDGNITPVCRSRQLGSAARREDLSWLSTQWCWRSSVAASPPR